MLPAGYAVASLIMYYQVIRRLDIIPYTVDGTWTATFKDSIIPYTVDGTWTATFKDSQIDQDRSGVKTTIRRRAGSKLMRGSNITFTILGLSARVTSGLVNLRWFYRPLLVMLWSKIFQYQERT